MVVNSTAFRFVASSVSSASAGTVSSGATARAVFTTSSTEPSKSLAFFSRWRLAVSSPASAELASALIFRAWAATAWRLTVGSGVSKDISGLGAGAWSWNHWRMLRRWLRPAGALFKSDS
ncbi:hypothetical protein DF160_09545 [Burkholderia anthina]|nr:hypothetical protein DF160_09545 [Burkholderia anthina]